MFFKKKEKADYSVFVIGIIALLILFSVGVVFTLLAQRPDISNITTNPRVKETVNKIIAHPRSTPEKVSEDYKEKIRIMLEEVEKLDDINEAIKIAEETLLSVRTPSQTLELHFQVVVLLNKLKENTENQTDTDRKDLLTNEIKKLINGVNSSPDVI